MRESWRVFHDRLLLGRCFRGNVLPVLEKYSAEWCSVADTHQLGVCVKLHIIDLWQYYVSYKIRYNLMHALYGDLPVPCVPVLVTSSALVAQWRMTFIPLLVSLRFLVWGLAGFKSRANVFLLSYAARSHLSSTVFPFSL